MIVNLLLYSKKEKKKREPFSVFFFGGGRRNKISVSGMQGKHYALHYLSSRKNRHNTIKDKYLETKHTLMV